MKFSLKNIVLMVLMLASAGLGAMLRPTELMADAREKIDLETMVPQDFGDWKALKQSSGQIINPQQTELLSKLYAQTLSRTYLHPDGSMIMLSIAYGTNQSDGLALHYPDVCYPAQGFKVKSNQKAELSTTLGSIRVRQLETELGNRHEPVTYWSTIGNHLVQGGTETKMTQLEYGFKGQVPDGLIFRVSSITRNTALAYKVQEQFVGELLEALTPQHRQFLAGISPKNTQ